MATGRGEGLRRLGLLAAVVAILAVYAVIWARGESWLPASVLPVSSPLAVATATLLAAAVFRPVLRRVQGVVDRRFNRERYEAELVVEAFGARPRGATDPDAAAEDLPAAVDGALQPCAAGLWPRGGAR